MDLEVVGRHALLFDDDATAAFVNSRDALVPWSVDESLLIDRYDVRHLLDRPPLRPTASVRRHRSAADPDDLDRERYLDLPPPDADPNDEQGVDSSSEIPAGSGSYKVMPFSYGYTEVSVNTKNPDSDPNDSGFVPTFLVPEHLLSNLPPTEKSHQIIARTAIFVSEHGGQSEIILRVKQGDNPTFGFLMPDHHLHSYFRFLVDHPQLVKPEVCSDRHREEKIKDNQENGAGGGGALSLLGSVYGSVEDDDIDNAAEDGTNKGKNKDADAKLEKVEYAVKGEPSAVVVDSKTEAKGPDLDSIREQILSARHFLNSVTTSTRSGKKKKYENPPVTRKDKTQTSKASIAEDKSVLVEPPLFLRKTMEKIVGLILKNGKDFEAALIEQEKNVGRFPFLLQSNQHHSYFMKLLQDAREGKQLGKPPFDSGYEEKAHAGQKKKVKEEVNIAPTAHDHPLPNDYGGWLGDRHKKEKFKMVIGGPKKDAQSQNSMPARQVSADEAAAIVMAATRGISPANARNFSSIGVSSTGSLSNGGAGISGSLGKQMMGGSGKIYEILVAKAVAKTAALAASSEADSSEAGLTKEQKLKAERLKRAKMFVAMLKPGSGNNIKESVDLSSKRSGSEDVSVGGPKQSSMPSDAKDGEGPFPTDEKEREGSYVPVDAEVLHGEISYNTIPNRHHKERQYRKKHHLRSVEDEDENLEDVYKHSKKKRRYERSHNCSDDDDDDHDGKKRKSRDDHGHKHLKSKHRHRNREHSSQDEDEEDKRSIRHKRKSNRHSRRRHHSDDDDYDDDDGNDHEKYDRRRSRSEYNSGGKRNRETGEAVKAVDNSGDVGLLGLSNPPEKAANDQPSSATEVPDDLRAKIRAMLLQTM